MTFVITKVLLMKFKQWAARFMFLVTALILGCGDSPAPSTAEKPKAKAGRAKPAADDADDEETATGAAVEKPKKPKFQAVKLGGDEGGTGGAGGGSTPKARLTGEKRLRAVIAALQPLQILLGDWRWITNKEFGGTKKAAEDLKWVWDFKTDETQPSLTATSDLHPYFKQIWLTYLPDDDKFKATAQAPDGQRRVFLGTWTEGGEPKEESDGKKIQHTFKMQLNQTSPAEGDQWQLVMNQLDNNQYLTNLTRRPATGKQYGPLDVVRQQRLGTSFAVADSDNPGPKCIISGGLGTMSVSYKGKSYPVCCSGCAAAFNDDPEKWLAKLAAREKAKKSGDE
ncbi:MAG TPA: hypothetical protein VGH74_02300 [Planctomycetaceae bacterium]|jgi:hypothetical protein